MKNFAIILVVCFMTQIGFSQWTSANLSEAKYDLNALSSDDKLFFVGGEIIGGGGTDVIDIYTSSSDTWSTITIPEIVLDDNRNVLINNKLYVQQEFRKFLIYDIDTETWTELETDVGAVHVTTMDDYLVIADSDELALYDTSTGLWQDFEFTRRDGTSVTAANGKIFIAGGAVSGVEQDLVEILDLASGVWTTGVLSIPRENIKSIVHNDKAYFVGGEAADFARVGRLDIYDINNDTWSIDSLSVDRWDFDISVYEDKLFFIGGQVFDFFDQYVSVVDIYDTKWEIWQTMDLPTGRAELATAAHNGKLFCAGGESDEENRESIVEIYDLDQLSSADNLDLDEFAIYPNPTNNYLSIKSESNISSIQLYDSYGKVIRNISNLATLEYRLNTTTLNTGYYLIRMNGGDDIIPFIKN